MRRKNLCCIGDEIDYCDDLNVINDNNDNKVINDSYDSNDTNDMSFKTYKYMTPKAITESP